MADLRDAIYGLAIGDALGVPYEFMGRDSFTVSDKMVGGGAHQQPPGTFSDDTSMALATCASIKKNNGRIDIEDIAQEFENWAYRGRYAIDGLVFDVGSTVARAIDQKCGQDGEWDNGNGSLMRIVPLAFCGATDNEVREVSAITHAHPISTETCVKFVHIARELSKDENPRSIIKKHEPEILDMVRGDVKSSGFVLDTYGAALWCVANTATYKDAVMEAVDLGGDTDTTAAVAGALAGIIYGVEAIPESWMETLRGKDIIESCL